MKRFVFFILLITLTLSGYSKSKYIKYKFDKTKVIYGDSLLLSWEAPKRYEVEISGIDSVFSHIGQTYIQSKEKERITITATRGKKKLTRRTRLIRIIYPELHYFIAIRDKDNPSLINIEWNTENYKNITIEGVGSNLDNKGTAIINEPGKIKLSIEVVNYLGEKFVKYVDVPKDYSQNRNYLTGIRAWKEKDSIPFFMDIISMNTSNYPNHVELKVIAYDTLGNYITGMAPPKLNVQKSNEIFRRVFVKSRFGENPVTFKVHEIYEETRSKSDIAFVMDHSGSMNEVLDNFKEIASYFVSNKNPNDRMSLVVFDHRIYRLAELTSDAKSLEGAINENPYVLGGSTALYAACDEGLETIRYSERDKALIVFTDGRENSSFPYYGFRATEPNYLANKIRKMKARLYVIGYGESVNGETLEELCKLSNGKFYYINNIDELKNALFEIDLLINSYYSITFTPPKTNGLTKLKFVYRNFNSDLLLEEDYFIGDIHHIVERQNNTINKKDSINIIFPPQVIANFEYNKSFIENKYFQPLQKYAQYLKENPGVEVSVAGHSDSRGNEKIRQRISQKRADAVAEYFVQQGISPERIKKEYYSFSRPLHPDEDHEWQARENRRVEIIIYKNN